MLIRLSSPPHPVLTDYNSMGWWVGDLGITAPVLLAGIYTFPKKLFFQLRHYIIK